MCEKRQDRSKGRQSERGFIRFCSVPGRFGFGMGTPLALGGKGGGTALGDEEDEEEEGVCCGGG